MKPFNAHFKEYLSDEEEEEEFRKQPKEKFGHSIEGESVYFPKQYDFAKCSSIKSRSERWMSCVRSPWLRLDPTAEILSPSPSFSFHFNC